MTRPLTLTTTLAAALVGAFFTWHGAYSLPQRQSTRAGARPAAAVPALRPTRTIRAHGQVVHVLAYSRDGKRIVSAGWDRRVKVWEAGTGRLVRSFATPTQCLTLSPDGQWLATGSHLYRNEDAEAVRRSRAASRVKVWSMRTGRLVRTLEGHGGVVGAADWSPDGKLLATDSGDPAVQIWRTDTWRPVASLKETFPYLDKEDSAWTRQGLFSPDGSTLAVVSMAYFRGEPGYTDARVVLWDTGTWQRRRMLPFDFGHLLNRVQVAFSPDGRTLEIISDTGTVEGDLVRWDTTTGKYKEEHRAEGGLDLAFLHGGQWLAVGGVSLLNVKTRRPEAVLPHSERVEEMAASPDGRVLVTGDAYGFLRCWEVP
jgi:WD40 repeat protein